MEYQRRPEVEFSEFGGLTSGSLHTNSKELRLLWARNGLSDEVGFEGDSKFKVLVLIWNSTDDSLSVYVELFLYSLESLRNTKRFVLNTAAKVFDLVGFIYPFAVRIKKLMQEIWERGVDLVLRFTR
ncbi:integrase catalytic domain-containing protein [Nephila pilipes]|uniref:Integrase catalytic domain-containing protein n=1 Tax=Nephila pilipes TaxID=299642 RepID=A0A8X6P4L9_NEPPI|nr:integrase catalytic domain-containing protein [Nephila pilipes]